MAQTFKDRIRETRERKGLSQNDLAEKAGMQASAISHFESGRRAPSFDNLRKLADALDVSIDFLLGRTDDAAAAGPRAQKLFRDFAKLSAADQDNIASFANVLAKKNEKRKDG